MGRFVLAVILSAGVVGGFGSALASWSGGGHCHRQPAAEGRIGE